MEKTRIRPDIGWKEIANERYQEQLEVLWPACNMSRGWGFLMGEPYDHGPCTVRNIADGVPRYSPFLNANGKCYEGDKPMTLWEFRELSIEDRADAIARAVKL